MRTVAKRQGDKRIDQFAFYYDLQHSQYLEDLPFWLNLVKQRGEPVLELGCGTGRITLPLAEHGIAIYGLDNDACMLKYLVEHKTIPAKAYLLLADMGRFRLDMQFPLVIMPCNTYATLDAEQRARVLGNARQLLCERGCFCVSLPNPLLLKQLPGSAEVEIEDTFIHPVNGAPIQLSTAWERTAEQMLTHYHYDTLHDNGRVTRFSHTLRHWIVEPAELIAEMQRAGFGEIITYGDFDHRPFDGQSPYLILQVRK